MIRKNYIITGKVQMVGFRARVQEEAENLKLTGFVRNESDGSVHVESQGPEDDLSWFEDGLKLGPPAARVEKVESNLMDVITDEEAFEIR